MATYGKIKSINPRGFTFLRSDDGDEIFAHASQFLNRSFDSLNVGDPVEYTETVGRDAKRAAQDVRVL